MGLVVQCRVTVTCDQCGGGEPKPKWLRVPWEEVVHVTDEHRWAKGGGQREGEEWFCSYDCLIAFFQARRPGPQEREAR